jgi:hypothetical protein
MHSIAFTDSRRPLGVVTGRLVVHVGVDRHMIRSQPVWPIADVLGVEEQMDALLAGSVVEGSVLEGCVDDAAVTGGQPSATELLHDLLDSQMITPPRPRRRRQRAVSSRAVFYQGPDRQDGSR